MSQFTDLEAKIIATMPKPKKNAPPPSGKDLLSRMRSLMDALGNPEKSLKIIHVAGTSGKTSTSYFLASLLTSTGLKTGLTISPDIDNVRERAIINLQPLPENEWCQHMHKFFTLVQNTNIQPSYFEFFMGFAFWLFQKLQVDYVILETGLGGTWDGSNVAIAPNKICAITDISYDHVDILGTTIAEITAQKAGIIHAHNTVFMNAQSPEVTDVIRGRCREIGAYLHITENAPTEDFIERNFYLARSIASFALDRDHLPPLTPNQITTAKQTKIPARAEPLKYAHKTIIMDGSHNPQKLQALHQHLQNHHPSTSRILIATLGSNKLTAIDESMAILRKISDHIILTSFKHNSPETDYRESARSEALIKSAQKFHFKTAEYISNPQTATKKALQSPHQQIIITGSFYLLKHIRPHILSLNPSRT